VPQERGAPRAENRCLVVPLQKAQTTLHKYRVTGGPIGSDHDEPDTGVGSAMSHDFEANRSRSGVPNGHETLSAMGDIAAMPDKTGRDP
jgi:hypothetical protein